METNVLLDAIRDGCDVDFVKDQLQAGADINATDSSGNTALMLAARYSSHELVQALLDAGADVNKVNSEGLTALMLAAAKSNPMVVKVLLSAGAYVNKADSCGNTVLMLAARHNSPGVVKLLLDAGSYLNKVNSYGGTALMLAAQFNSNPLVLQVLLDAGADVDKALSNGWTALMLAAQYNSNPGVVQALLDARADVDKSLYNGKTALMLAALHSSLEVVTALLVAGAEVNKDNSHGETALKLALNATADVNKSSDDGNTASKDSGERLIALLLAYGGLLSTRDFDKPSFSRLNLIRKLIAYNAEDNNEYYANIFRECNTYELNKSCYFSPFRSVSKASRENHIFAPSITDTDSNSRVWLNEDVALLICSFLRPPPSASYLVLFNKLKDESLVKGFINSRSAQRAFPGIERLRFDESQVALLMGSDSDRKELSMELDPGRKDLSIG